MLMHVHLGIGDIVFAGRNFQNENNKELETNEKRQLRALCVDLVKGFMLRVIKSRFGGRSCKISSESLEVGVNHADAHLRFGETVRRMNQFLK